MRKTREPRILTSRFESKCAETGKVIKKGETCVYYPSSKDVFHTSSKQYQEYKEMKDDELRDYFN